MIEVFSVEIGMGEYGGKLDNIGRSIGVTIFSSRVKAWSWVWDYIVDLQNQGQLVDVSEPITWNNGDLEFVNVVYDNIIATALRCNEYIIVKRLTVDARCGEFGRKKALRESVD